MVESVLLVALGFAVAGLLALSLAPLVRRRAVRLTKRRMEAILPLSIKEVRADRDRLRAEFALKQRQLERERDAARESEAAERTRVGGLVGEIDRLRVDNARQAQEIEEMTALDEGRRATIGALEAELGTTRDALATQEETGARLARELDETKRALGEVSLRADGQRAEIAALRTQVGGMRDSIAELEAMRHDLERRLGAAQSEREAALAEGARLDGVVAERDRRLAEKDGERLRLREELRDKLEEIRELQARVTAQAAEALRRDRRLRELEGGTSRVPEGAAPRPAVQDARGRVAGSDARQVGNSAATPRGLDPSGRREEAGQASDRGVEALRSDLSAFKRDLLGDGAAGSESAERAVMLRRLDDLASRAMGTARASVVSARGDPAQGDGEASPSGATRAERILVPADGGTAEREGAGPADARTRRDER